MTDSPTPTTPIEYAVPPTLKPSRLGRASFILAIAAVAAFVGVFSVITGRPVSDMRSYKLLGLCMILPVVGTGLGIAAVCQRHRYRGLAVAGLTINVLLTGFELLITVPSLIYELTR